jgi:arylsulfatase A
VFQELVKMNRRNFLKYVSIAGTSIGVSGCVPKQFSFGRQPRKPNIIVIFADDLGYGDLASYGHPTIATPNLDRMVEQGQKWTSFYAAAPVCSPSRSALMTGRYPIRLGTDESVFFEWSADGLSTEEVTIAQTLKHVGYATACVGKWHLGHLSRFLPTSRGFDEYYGIPYSNDMRVDPNMKVSKDVNFRESATLEKMRNPENRKGGWVPLMEGEEVVEYPCDQTTLTGRYAERCVDFIRNNSDRPFFLYMAHSFPHVPLFASEEFSGKSRRGLYGDVVEELDASVGRILETLREQGLENDTLVVFTSDNGPWLSKFEQGGCSGLLRGGKGQTYEGGMREPGIFYWPGRIAAGSVVMDIGTTMDLYKTFCSLSGAKTPDGVKLDSFDLSPALFGFGSSPRKTFFYYRNREIYAVRHGEWKLHFITQGAYGQGEKKTLHNPPLLYHLGHDPGENYNVAGDHPEVVEEIKAIAKLQSESVVPGESRYIKKFDWKDS